MLMIVITMTMMLMMIPFHKNNNLYVKYLMIKFRCNSHIQVHVKLIMMGNKRFGCRTSWYHIHHRCLHLKSIIHIAKIKAS